MGCYKQGVLTENLWPKLFSEAPRCAPLRLPYVKASRVPYSKPLKIRREPSRGSVGIAADEERITPAVPRNRRANPYC